MAKEIWQGSTGAQGNNWNVGGNWNTGVVPQAGDDVEIPTGTPTPNLMGATATVATVTVDNGASADLTGQLTVTGDFVDNGGASVDTGFLVEFGGSNLTIGGTLTATNSGGGFSIGNRAQTSNTTVTANAVTNIGAINIAGNATGVLARLNVVSAAGFGGTAGVLTGNINLGIGVGGAGGPGDALLDFLGGGLINTIQGGNVALNGALAFIASGGATTSNSALTGPLTIAAGGGLHLQAGAAVTTQALTVAGSVSVDTDFLGIGGSILTVSGLIAVTGNLGIGRSAMTTASATVTATGGLTSSGTISLNGDKAGGFQGTLNVGTAAGFGTPGVLTGNVNLAGFSLLDFAGGGTIGTIKDGSVQFDGANAFLASGGATTSNSALAGPLTIAANGGLNLQGGTSITTQALTDAGNISVDTGFLGIGGSTLTVNGLLTVSGILTIGREAMTVASATVTATSGLANTGSVNLNGDKQHGFQGILNVGTGAGFGSAGMLTGNVNLIGFSLLDFASGQITSIDKTGTLAIDGTNAFLASGAATTSNSALSGLATMNGFFTLTGGAALTTGNDLSIANGVNFSNLNVDNSGAGGSVLQIGGTLTINTFGGITIGNGGITAAATVTAKALNFAGAEPASITLIGATAASSGTAQATLTVASAAGFGATGTLSGGDLTLVGKTLLDFTQGGQLTSTAFGANMTIDGSSAFIASGNAVSSNSALAGLTTLGGNLTLRDGAAVATTGDLTISDGAHGNHLTLTTGSSLTVGGKLTLPGVGNIALDAGDAGGSSLTVTSTLSNAGGIGIGNKGITASTTASAAGLVNSGQITITGASATNTATLSLGGAGTNTGSVLISAFAKLDDGANAYTQASGSTVIAGTLNAAVTDITGGTLELAAGGVVTGGIAFAAASGQLKIDGTTMPSNTISGFTKGDTIDLAGVAFSAAGTVGLQAGNVLQVKENGSTFNLNLDPAQNFAGVTFQLTDDKSAGTLVSEAVCFCRGTRILAERGEVAVEDLAVGERVVTLSGALRPIVWIGFGRDLLTRANRLARPIIVRQGALADGVPTRDLYLTHGHALYLDGALIPVEHLVNHKTILWDESARVIEYYHIELDDHDVLLAEGAPAESYYAANNRALFQNLRAGSEAGGDKPPFAPVLNGGDLVESVWARLFRRGGGKLGGGTTDDPDLHLLVDGFRLDPIALDGDRYSFTLERPPAGGLRLRSRAGVPSLLGESRSDHRRLGVAITQIVLRHAGIATHFDYDQPQLREGGCYKHEDGFAWTDGEFRLPARFCTGLSGPCTLTVQIRQHGMRYPVTAAAAEAA